MKITQNQKKICVEYDLTSIDPSAVYTWLQKLGFQYEPKRKGHYVNMLGKPSNIWGDTNRCSQVDSDINCRG